ncbi:hypothetical protein ABZP36_011644 [Zizania latifolia]
MLLARKGTLLRAALYIVEQYRGAVCGVALVRALNSIGPLHAGRGTAAAPTSSTPARRLLQGRRAGRPGRRHVRARAHRLLRHRRQLAKLSARESHIPVLAPLHIDFAVFVVHLATIPITSINPARSFGAAVIYQPGNHMEQ